MTDDFNQALWKIASTSPDLQEAIRKSMSKPSKEDQYFLPRGDFRDAIFNHMKDDEQREKWLALTKKAYEELTLKHIAHMQDELRVALTIKEVKGEELHPIEKTLKDVNLLTLSILLLVEWQKHITHEDTTPKGDKA